MYNSNGEEIEYSKIEKCELPTTDKITLSEEQNKALDFVNNFLKSDKKYIVIGGCAGTGKSSIIPEIVNIYGRHATEVLAYTGKAVVVLKRKGISQAKTIHSFLYKPEKIEKKDGTFEFEFQEKPSYYFNDAKLVVIDEASMLSRSMFDTLNKYKFKVIYIGDHYQLPPIGDSFNIMNNPDFVMTKILRQMEDNPIIQLAELARHKKNIPFGNYGKSRKMFGVKEEWLPLYSQIITWTNDKKESINNTIRSLKEYDGQPPLAEEKMIVKANNRRLNVFNGQMIYLTIDSKFNRNYYDVEFIDELAHDDIVSMVKYGTPIKAKATLRLDKDEIEKYISPYKGNYNKKDSAEWKAYQFRRSIIHLDYGYAITCHAAQGSSWENVCVIDEPKFKQFENYYRWLYTAITRAEKTITICSGEK